MGKRRVPPNKISVGLIQFKVETQPVHNLLKAVQLVRTARKKGADVICLPELFKSHYFPQSRSQKNFELAEEIPGPTTKLFTQLARELKAVLILPLFERTEKGCYFNSLVIIDVDGTVVGKYRKMHLPNDPAFYEQYYFDEGNLGFKAVQTAYGKIGALICWDQWFPEAARLLALRGAEIIFYPTAIGSHKRQNKKEVVKEKSAWETVQRSHAIANGVFVASVNRVGRENNLTFWGSSFICGPFGEILKQADESRQQILIETCDLNQISKIRKYWPFLKERRIDAYKN